MPSDLVETFKSRWPAAHAVERAKVVESTLSAAEAPQTAAQLAKQFLRAKPTDVEEILKNSSPLTKRTKATPKEPTCSNRC